MTIASVVLAAVLGVLSLIALVWNAVEAHREGRKSSPPRVSFSELEGRGWVIWETVPEAHTQLALF